MRCDRACQELFWRYTPLALSHTPYAYQVLEESFWRIFIMGHLLPPQPRRRTERRPEEEEGGGGEGRARGEATCCRAGLDTARGRGGEGRGEHPYQRSRGRQARLARMVGMACRRRRLLRALRCLPPLRPTALPTVTLRHPRCAPLSC